MAPLLLLCFGSGAAALVYEVVWFQLLELVIGSTVVSLAILLSTFMGGMCLGSLLLPRLVPAQRNPLRVYACIEFGIGVLGILALQVLPLVGSVYTFRGVVAAACLLPPTLLMGATLPALARQAEGVAWLGFYYGANIAGAVFGCLLAGFYLLREYDVAVATYVAVAINISMAGVALAFRKFAPSSAADDRVSLQTTNRDSLPYIAIALSGLCALAAETIWTRLLGLLFGASVYALSIILAAFLVGLGIGSGAGALLCRILVSPRQTLGWCQCLAACAVAWAAFNLSASLPYWPINPAISSNIWFTFELDLARAFWTLLPPTLLWGASFPLALAAACSKGQDSAKLMAGVYAANTFGAIIGALSASLFLIPWVGSQHAQQVLIALSMIGGLLLVLPKFRWMGGAAVLLAGVLIYTVPPLAKPLVAYGRYAATWVGKSNIIYADEGMNSSVAVASFPNGALTFHVAGKIQASNVPRDMRLQRMLGHLTTLTNAHPRSILVIGCGAGITAGAASVDPRVEREAIVEIEPLVPQAASQYFNEPNFAVLRNPKVRVRIDDGRHYLLTTKERFDGITIDPLDPWVKGAANLYTNEFLEALRQHLNPGGVVTMYIQLFETDLEAVKSSVATFFEVFPNGTIWGNPYQGQGHDMVLLGQVEPLRIDLDEMEHRIGYRGGDSKIAQSLAEIGMNSPVDLFATYAGRKSDLTQWLQDASINRDRNLRMQYLAGLGLNLDEAATIYGGMLAYRRFPEDLFISTESRVDSLRRAMNESRRP
ncbi:MAG TPA: fused MFS/spermidine synthase [Bryobacteraceae bacterium]|jgi:spermidine synthase|nr:fused MFS/spermidine synthase [Bryobacteraceae bacterium]